MPSEKLPTRYMGEMAMGLFLSAFSGLMVSIVLSVLVMMMPAPEHKNRGFVQIEHPGVNQMQRDRVFTRTFNSEWSV